MKFKYSCVVFDNSEELRNGLEALGYELSGKTDGSALTAYANGIYKTAWEYTNPYTNVIIDCHNNGELFLAIAAIRDDSDENQWFVTEADQAWVNIGVYMPKGSFFKCFTKDVYPEELKGKEKFCNSLVPIHKATIDELINYFKTGSEEVK